MERKLSLALCFFFQAEDGIRDYKVTGVQTCALPIYQRQHLALPVGQPGEGAGRGVAGTAPVASTALAVDRKSTRLNSSHLVISYAVFCLKKIKTPLAYGNGQLTVDCSTAVTDETASD